MQHLGKVAGAVGTFALASTGLPPAAEAAKKAKEVVETVDNTKQLITGGAAVIAAGAVGMKVLGEAKQVHQVLEEQTRNSYNDTFANLQGGKGQLGCCH